MEVFNKIYSQVSSSVSSTVSQLSGVLPGNPVTREFDASSHIASGGPGLLWKIYKGVKRSTKQEASIFVFEKRQLEKWNKADRDLILESLKRGITQLTKIRHPRVLTVQHPLEESRESLAFATEPVFASLANILGQTVNMPQPANLSDYKFFDIEIKYGLLQLGEGLTFLHNDVKLLHRNICPESIIINQQGAWKIFGFDFCVHNTSPPNSPPFYPFDGHNPTLPNVAQPLLDYLAPEYILTQTHSTSTDIFALGMLAYALHSIGGQVISPSKDIQQYKSRVRQLKQLPDNKLQCVPDALKEYVKLMLNVTPEVRPDAHQFVKIPYFDDIGVKTLTYLDSLLQWDNLQKSQFYKGLPEALSKLPHRVQIQRVLTCLSRDLAQPTMIPFVLPSILDIAQQCDKNEFTQQILPHIKPVMKIMDPIQILLIFLQRMELLLKLTPPEDVQQHVLPMLYRGLDSDTPQIHELCLSVLPTFAGLLDHANVKNSLLPRIKKLCLSTSSLSVRVNCLLCVGRLLEHLDKWLVLDEILPFLPQIPSREPAVLMGILGIYKLALNHKKLGISKEVIATRILPFLMPLCIENGLTLPQFNALVALVKQMFQLVENEHRTKLEQLNTVHEQQKVLESTMPVTSSISSKPVQLDQAFTGLGLDSFVTSSSLSIQDKQRIAKQQDTMKILQNQPAIEPIAPPKSKSSAVAKDLSLSLLDSNVGATKIAAPPGSFSNSVGGFVGNTNAYNSNFVDNNSGNNSSFSTSTFPTNNSFNSGFNSVNQNVNQNSSMTSPQMSFSQMTSPTNNSQMRSPMNNSQITSPMNNSQSKYAAMSWPSGNQANVVNASIPSNQFNTTNAGFPTAQWSGGQNVSNWQASNMTSNPWASNQPMNQSNSANQSFKSSDSWSALDNLLPTQQGKVPMNQMMMHKQPLLQSPIGNNTTISTSANSKLSNDDIMDLLS